MKNQDAIILALAKEHFFVETLEVRNLDRLDFHDVSVGSIKAALRDALEYGYAAGLAATPQAAPAKPLQATIELKRLNTTLTLHEERAGAVVVNILDATGLSQHELDVTTLDNVELMAAHFEDIKVGVFVEVMKLLAAFHNKTIQWD